MAGQVTTTNTNTPGLVATDPNPATTDADTNLRRAIVQKLEMPEGTLITWEAIGARIAQVMRTNAELDRVVRVMDQLPFNQRNDASLSERITEYKNTVEARLGSVTAIIEQGRAENNELREVRDLAVAELTEIRRQNTENTNNLAEARRQLRAQRNVLTENTANTETILILQADILRLKERIVARDATIEDLLNRNIELTATNGETETA